ncbi:NnrS family protein [Pseudorhodobacter sp.]|uniref:NnrS family protein n=1 Tax=Pseudorhodobacter sp. TaxID=1934400 RepID=UPI002AFE2ECA|nr:NnrS family protein [Pseudorhodobacter sp.]
MTALHRFFNDGFRVFFTAAALYAIFAIGVWDVWLIWADRFGAPDMPFAPAPHLWHAHEMIFGYGTAALAGFFLTAVPNWTGARAAPHVFVAVVAGLWLLGRVGLWFSGSLSPLLVMGLDLAFVPVLAAKILTQLLKRPKPQNMLFLAVLAVLWLGNLFVHLEWAGLAADTAWAGLRAGLLSLIAMIAILGGRVTPAFTKNAMVQSGTQTGLPRNPTPLTGVTIAAALALPMGYLLSAPAPVQGGIAIIAGISALARLALWRTDWTLRKPILWALHLGYFWLGLGLVLLGLSDFGIGSEIAAVHLLGIGAVGGMTIAVMSRATLGHSGRPLVASRAMTIAYGLVALAALLRWVGSSLPALGNLANWTAGALWVTAFLLFIISLWSALTGPRLAKEAKP